VVASAIIGTASLTVTGAITDARQDSQIEAQAAKIEELGPKIETLTTELRQTREAAIELRARLDAETR
jgi:outer membrane murein-binding lipoprotein Lpp